MGITWQYLKTRFFSVVVCNLIFKGTMFSNILNYKLASRYIPHTAGEAAAAEET